MTNNDYEEMLKSYKLLTLSEIKPRSGDNALFIIGNGFDLMHGAKSRYYDFEKTLRRDTI